jgi:hypothetical protein
MGKVVAAVFFFVALARAIDTYFFYGKYTDAAIFVAMQVLQSFGI